MQYPIHFIKAGNEYADVDHLVPAPYIRKSFGIDTQVKTAKLLITGLGFYRIFVNGREITKGILAPYISNPDDLVYYDSYDVTKQLTDGENVIGVMLGNGMQNAFGGYIWGFDKARWRDVPMTAFRLDCEFVSGKRMSVESDESCKVHSSPLLFDELRCGEYYDARLEIPGWCTPGFDDSGWANVLRAVPPRGELRICEAEPIVKSAEITAVSIVPYQNGYLYDFGVNSAGVCRLRIEGEAGQEIVMHHCEWYHDGILEQKNINFEDRGDPRAKLVQVGRYTCRGGSPESYSPAFAYYGFRYVYVEGITPSQATPALLTYEVMHSDLEERGDFRCSDKTANKLQELTRRSTLANFYYFPTDCPHREKNGWTGDAAMSAEHTLLNLSAEKSYREWLRNITAAQNKQGALPGIVPTGGWGFTWGNGPAWDCVLIYLPYYIYKLRGDREVVRENEAAIFRYLHYMNTRRDERGLVAIGLGDWCQPGHAPDKPKSPLVVTDTAICLDIAAKSAELFDALGMREEKRYARDLWEGLRASFRRYLIDFPTMTVSGACQTSQAAAIYFDIFDSAEKQAAFERLKEFIAQENGHLDAGMIGLRILFHVLSDFGEADLAYQMITRPDFPSYGNWVASGATSLREMFQQEGENAGSLNHHFFGDISSWFIQGVAGIVPNPYGEGCDTLAIRPNFITGLSYAEAYHQAPAGRIEVKWEREKEEVLLTVTAPATITGVIRMPKGWTLASGLSEMPLSSGRYWCKAVSATNNRVIE